MLTKQNLRALSIGQWARTVVPHFDAWTKESKDYEFGRPVQPGDEVDVCVVPRYGPRNDSDADSFEWSYRLAYRRPGSRWPKDTSPDGHWLSTYDLGLSECTRWNYDSEEQK